MDICNRVIQIEIMFRMKTKRKRYNNKTSKILVSRQNVKKYPSVDKSHKLFGSVKKIWLKNAFWQLEMWHFKRLLINLISRQVYYYCRIKVMVNPDATNWGLKIIDTLHFVVPLLFVISADLWAPAYYAAKQKRIDMSSGVVQLCVTGIRYEVAISVY